MENLVNIFQAYKGKKVFLTGHTGFKGSWLLVWLHSIGAEVRGYAKAPEFDYELYNEIGGDAICESVIDDIRNGERLKAEIREFKPDFIFHLAAQPLVRLSYQLPVETFEVNAMGTAHLLDAVRQLDNRCSVVLVTTDKVYENFERDHAYQENDRLGGYDPYSASKACAELVAESYRRSFFHIDSFSQHQKAIATARAGNVIGGGDWAVDRIIPDIIRSLRSGREIQLRNPKAIRPWQHVMEPLAGYLQLGLRLSEDPLHYSGSWNFGPMAEDNLTVAELAGLAVKAWGSGSVREIKSAFQPHEAGVLKLNISKAMNELNWKPRFNAAQAVGRTINWYRNKENGNAFDLVRNDILEFINPTID